MKKKTLTVVGLGYVGLPLAVQAAAKGCEVTGVDTNKQLVQKLNRRISPFSNDQRFNTAFVDVPVDTFRATTNFEPIANSEVVILCLPTPTDDNVPDLSYVISGAQQIAQRLQPKQLVVLESTVNPGVTRDVVLPILEQASGLRVGKDFFLAHCPERIDPGNEQLFVGNLNRVVGGVTPACTKRAVAFYEEIIDAEILPLASPEEAEFVKSWENTHRHVMIALANEAAMICDTLGMDISNVLRGLHSKIDQFGLSLAKPGIGPGGHCIPEDIHYVIQKARQTGHDTRFLDSAADLNNGMPHYAVTRLWQMAKANGDKLSDLKVGLLGVAYKENIEDIRRSPAIDVARNLAQRADGVFVHDPYASADIIDNVLRHCQRMDTLEEVLAASDAIFIATAHKEYIEALTPELLKKHKIKYILDGRNCLDKEEFLAAKLTYCGIGR